MTKIQYLDLIEYLETLSSFHQFIDWFNNEIDYPFHWHEIREAPFSMHRGIFKDYFNQIDVEYDLYAPSSELESYFTN